MPAVLGVDYFGNETVEIGDLLITIDGPRPDGSYAAWFGDYDLDCLEGWGKTRLAAASDLLDKYADNLITQLEKVLR